MATSKRVLGPGAKGDVENPAAVVREQATVVDAGVGSPERVAAAMEQVAAAAGADAVADDEADGDEDGVPGTFDEAFAKSKRRRERERESRG